MNSESQAKTTLPADSAKLFEESLHLLKKLFQQSGDHHWEERIERSIDNWKRIQSAHLFMGLYGGMGSISDSAKIGSNVQGREQVWIQSAYRLLLDVAYELARIQQGLSKKSVRYILDDLSTSKTFRVDSFPLCECKQCKTRWISQEDIERKVCSIVLPRYFAKEFAERRLSELFELDALINSSWVETTRSDLQEAVRHDGFEISTDRAAMRHCPKCASSERALVYFRFVYANDSWKLQRQKFLFGCIGLLLSIFFVGLAFLFIFFVAN